MTAASIARFTDGLIDLFLPRRCVECGAAGTWLCGRCAQGLRPLDGPHCYRCGRPCRAPARGCQECRGRELAFVSAAAAFSYSGPARSLVTTCKFRRYRSIARDMAALARPRFAQLAATAPGGRPFALATWVPTTPERRKERGFDQAELFARELTAPLELPLLPLLERRRTAAEQSGLGKADRAGNIRGGFVCIRPAALDSLTAASGGGARPSGAPSGAPPTAPSAAHPTAPSAAHPSAPPAARFTAAPVASFAASPVASPARATSVVQGAALTSSRKVTDALAKPRPRVIIIDDVYTTGETLNECSRALSEAGYEAHVFTFARTVRGHSD